MNWFFEQITYINVQTLIASIFSSILCLLAIKKLINLKKKIDLHGQQTDMYKTFLQKKAEIDQALEIAKIKCQQEIQTHYLQTQQKTTSLYRVYPELHLALKETQGLIYQLFYHSTDCKDEALTSWCALTKKLGECSLFLDDDLRKKCCAAKDILMSAIQSHANLDKRGKNVFVEEIHQSIEAVGNVMRSHLKDA